MDIWVKLLQKIACMFCSEPSKVPLLQKEVDAQVCFANYGSILYRELADAGEDEILERLKTNHARAGVYEEDVRVF